jgi:mannose-6-phosphate isomerase-like protein (cupin superfamily)
MTRASSPPPLDLAAIPAVPCPCGSTRRGFLEEGRGRCSLHLVEISAGSRTHWHERLTEVYYFLEGEGHMELDGKLHPVRPGHAVLVLPGTRHRAVPGKGPMKILNFVVPGFEPADERFD